jgi:hypothetical protein
MADAVLSGYDEIVSPENPSKRAEDARRTRLDEFAREYTRRMERDALEAEEEEEELAKMRYASDEGERYAAELERTLGSDDEEAREWRAIATGKLSPALDRAKRRPRGQTARTALFEEEMRTSRSMRRRLWVSARGKCANDQSWRSRGCRTCGGWTRGRSSERWRIAPEAKSKPSNPR